MKRKDTSGPTLAVVRLPELPLQILLRDRPEFVGRPAAVVAGEGPEAILTHISRPARRAGLRVGMTQGVARDRVPGLHTGVIADEKVQEIEANLAKGLSIVSPKVEPCTHFPATFFLDPTGMGRLFGGSSPWAASVNAYLRGRGLFGSVVVGFHRYRAYAVAGLRLGARVLETQEEELQECLGVSLHQAGLGAEACDDLAMLDVRTLGDLLALPGSELGGRFGVEVVGFRALFAPEGEMQLPLQPLGFEEPTEAQFEVHPPDRDASRLTFGIKGALHPLVEKLQLRGEAVRRVHIRFELDAPGRDPTSTRELQPEDREVNLTLEPAAATRDTAALIELLQLQMDKLQLAWPVESVQLRIESVRGHATPTALPGHRPARDPEAAQRALARIRAAHGPRSVVRAKIRDAHLPEGRFKWEPTLELQAPKNVELGSNVAHEGATQPGHRLMRRLGKPTPLRSVRPRGGLIPSRSTSTRDPHAAGVDTIPVGPGGERVRQMYGPYRISGGWWRRETIRDYYYAETSQGALLWVFWDRSRSGWFLHGRVD